MYDSITNVSMAFVNVLCTDGTTRPLDCHSMTCPSCGALITPVYHAMYGQRVILSQCPVHECGSFFLLKRSGGDISLLPNHKLASMAFSDTIVSISPDFVRIYNESYAAEQMSLDDICGVGYRKALEFLVKDYVSKGKTDEDIKRIRAKALAKCIDENVSDERIKQVAKRAVWLGNDETHYIRKWEGKDVHDLKGIIHLTIRWIEQEVETDALLKDMPKRL